MEGRQPLRSVTGADECKRFPEGDAMTQPTLTTLITFGASSSLGQFPGYLTLGPDGNL